MTQRPSTRTLPARAGMCVASLAALLAAIPAHASFLQGDTLAKVANVMAIMGEKRKLECEFLQSNNFAFGGINTSIIIRRWP